ncbi:retrotransposable element Tf2 155 kDa protein type 1 [Trichonephila inaurata madagascariensis]|uniref:Retrotransposable element Tf2 155 kDa protein type 1 n=1 Tax=Trichonephila inaurata madagascariensis TaxID=2747483 RepID=A0A8X6Y231_9ARAC|nr:retrotransposable element Tf2 155 kDa protein type 1 [Trichonephila inaurata madagascariensis]
MSMSSFGKIVTLPTFSLTKIAMNSFIKEPKLLTTHNIVTSGSPVTTKIRHLVPEKLEIAINKFEFLLEERICRPFNGPWANPLLLVQKKTGYWKHCGDNRALNIATQTDRYPFPHLHDLTHNLHRCTIFPTHNFERAYDQIPDEPSDKPPSAHLSVCMSSPK